MLDKFYSNTYKGLLVSNFSWLLFEKIFRYVLGLVVSVWLARYLGPENFGMLNYVIAYISFFIGLSSLGVPKILTRDLVNQKDRVSTLLGSSILIMLLGGIAAYILSIAVISFLRGNESTIVYLTLLIGIQLIFKSTRSFTCYFESIVKSKYQVYASSSAYFVVSLLKILAILCGASLLTFGFLVSFEVIVASLLLVFFYFMKSENRITLSIDRNECLRLLKDSYPLIFSTIVIALHLRVDQIMVRDISGNEEAGIYAVAVRLTEIWYFLPLIIQSTLFPGLVKLHKSNKVDFRDEMYRIISIFCVLSIIIALPVSVFSTFIITILFGADYISSAPVLAILIWALLFVSYNVIRNAYLYIENLAKIHFAVVLLGLVVNIIGNLIVIPQYGAIGASVITLISYSFSSIFANLFFKKIRFFTPMMLKVLVAPRLIRD